MAPALTALPSLPVTTSAIGVIATCDISITSGIRTSTTVPEPALLLIVEKWHHPNQRHHYNHLSAPSLPALEPAIPVAASATGHNNHLARRREARIFLVRAGQRHSRGLPRRRIALCCHPSVHRAKVWGRPLRNRHSRPRLRKTSVRQHVKNNN